MAYDAPRSWTLREPCDQQHLTHAQRATSEGRFSIADPLVALGGRITAIGRLKDLEAEEARTRIKAQGCAVAPRGLEIVHHGNERVAVYTLRSAREMGQLERVILGTDGPAGSGV